MKNKMICALLTTVMVLSFAACGSQGNGAAASTESTVASESPVTESNAEANTETASTESTSTAEGAYEDNFAVPTEDATAFAKKIQDAVAAEDLDALADLVNYPGLCCSGRWQCDRNQGRPDCLRCRQNLHP